jgi:hypothetical protein
VRFIVADLILFAVRILSGEQKGGKGEALPTHARIPRVFFGPLLTPDRFPGKFAERTAAGP